MATQIMEQAQQGITNKGLVSWWTIHQPRGKQARLDVVGFPRSWSRREGDPRDWRPDKEGAATEIELLGARCTIQLIAQADVQVQILGRCSPILGMSPLGESLKLKRGQHHMIELTQPLHSIQIQATSSVEVALCYRS